MNGLLKCYYGYRNRGDELLMMGVIDYLFDHYSLTHLAVEVDDHEWIVHRCDLNHDRRQQHSHHVSFVTTRKISMWTARYDTIFAGGGEVLAAQTRDFWRAGVNYLALFRRWIWSGKVVRLGGIETPTRRYSKILYRMMLPYAYEIVCRERTSYELALKYTDKVVLYHDWAIDVIETKNLATFNNLEISSQKSLPVQKIILLHGKKSLTSKHSNLWIERTKNQLESKGYIVKTPIVERSWKVGWSGWKQILDQYIDFIDENTLLVGHSAGAAAIVRRLGENHIMIKKLILVAPGYISLPFDSGILSQPTGELSTDDGDDGMRDLYNFAIEPHINDLIKENTIIYTSNDDERFLQSAQKYLDILDAQHIILGDRGHFNNSYGPQNAIFPELVQEIISFGAGMNLANHSSLPESNQKISEDHLSQTPKNPYIIINLIPKHTTIELIQEFNNRIRDYSDHQIINFPAEEGDRLPTKILEQYGDRITTRQRTDHDASQSLALFEGASGAFVHRLHCVIPVIFYNIPMHTAAYSEKVNKIIAMMTLKHDNTPV